MNRTMTYVAGICMTFALTITLTVPATARRTTVRGWCLDGTGLLIRATDGRLEPAPWAWCEWESRQTGESAAGYEDQVTEFDSRSEALTHHDAAGSEALEWFRDDRGAANEDRHDGWHDDRQDLRADDRYHDYADGAEQ